MLPTKSALKRFEAPDIFIWDKETTLLQRLFSNSYKLNPLNSLFGRLFLWFWLTTIAIIICTVLVVQQLIGNDDLQTIPVEEQQLLNVVVEEIDFHVNQLERRIPIRRVLQRASEQHKVTVLLVDSEDNRFIQSRSPRPPIPPEFQQRFINLKTSDVAYGFLVRRALFFGPKKITIRDREYTLFLGRPLRLPFRGQNRTLLAFMAIGISGALCFMLAWSLTRPIKRLRQATQKMAAGDLKAKVERADSRQDEIGKLSQDFNTMSEKVNDLLIAQKRLLADISHELRSPLARLQLAIGIAQENEAQENNAQNQNGAKNLTALARIEKEAHQIDAMIAQVLQLSRLESETQTLDRFPIKLSSMLDPLLSDTQFEAQSHDKTLIYSEIPDLELNIDAALFCKAIENVLRNALKYSQKEILLDIVLEESGLNFVICDDGDGVTENELDKLFVPFYRVSEARNRITGGTGLGLAIATQAVNAHNGAIKATNRPQGGLCVEIFLPFAGNKI